MSARAEAAEQTGLRIVQAAYALFSEHFYDEVTLEAIAQRAGVTAQTVLRRFGSKEGLVDAVRTHVRASVVSHRDEAPIGDVPGAIANLIEHYEREGDAVLHLLAQEDRVTPFKAATDAGRALHADWVARTFALQIERAGGRAAQRRRHDQLVAVCDVYVWKVLRRDRGLDRTQTERALRELVLSLVKES